MGAKQSADAPTETAAAATNDAASAPAPLLKFGVILQGLGGAGVSAVQSAAALPMGRVLHVDDRFLTSPPIYSTERNSPNRPDDDCGLWSKAERDVWAHGGRSVTIAVTETAGTVTAQRRSRAAKAAVGVQLSVAHSAALCPPAVIVQRRRLGRLADGRLHGASRRLRGRLDRPRATGPLG